MPAARRPAAPSSTRALAFLRPGDTLLVVWRLDRLGRRLPHLLETVRTLEDRGVGFRGVQEAIDTTTPGGRLVFHIFGAIAEFERDLIRERTRVGLAAARARARRGGRRAKLTDEQRTVARSFFPGRTSSVR